MTRRRPAPVSDGADSSVGNGGAALDGSHQRRSVRAAAPTADPHPGCCGSGPPRRGDAGDVRAGEAAGPLHASPAVPENLAMLYPVRKPAAGFSLIELLMVIVVLAVLAVIAVPQFANASGGTRVNSLATVVQTVRAQVGIYKLQHGDQLPDLA